MALAIYFVPDPAKGVAEMARVVRPRGPNRSFRMGRRRRKATATPVQSEMVAMGYTPSRQPTLMPRGLKHFTNCG